MAPIDVRQAVLQEAVARVGGLHPAAETFHVDHRIIALYLHGDMPVPGDLFLRATDIVLGDAPVDTSRLL